MSKILTVFAVVALVAAASLVAATETIRGEVVDVACQKTKGAGGGRARTHRGGGGP